MTVQAQLDLRASRLEWILCIEGIGWLRKESSFAHGFYGDVFITKDQDGDLAARLGCTVRHGLIMPSIALEESYDPITGEYKKGSMRFSIQDRYSVLLDTIRPLDTTGKRATLSGGSDLAYASTTVTLDESEDTFAAGETVWVAGREAVLLGSRAAGAGSDFVYTNSVRGYLGTPHGRYDPRPTGPDGLAWYEGTDVRDYNRFWWDRRVMLFAHVPGDPVADVALVYTGRLRGITQKQLGIVWDVPTVHDASFYMNGVHEAIGRNKVGVNEFVDYGGNVPGMDVDLSGHVNLQGSGELSPFYANVVDRRIHIFVDNGDASEVLALPFFYHYRQAAGGTAGVYSAVLNTPTTPQARTDAAGRYRIDQIARFGDQLLRVHCKAPDRGGNVYDFRTVLAQVWARELGSGSTKILPVTDVRFLLDNIDDRRNVSRFQVQAAGGGTRISRNPIDFALMVMTTMNSEFYRADVWGAGLMSIGFAGDPFDDLGNGHWAGYAVHAVEGANLGEARVITDSDRDTLILESAFSSAPTPGTEYQIRNSIYDVLPMGWGMGIQNHKIDIGSWEDVRDRYLSDAELGRFAIGDEDRINLWQLLHEHVFRPYGVLPFIDRTTGRLSARYIGEALPTGIDETYTAIGESDMLEVGDAEVLPRAPAGSVEVHVRSAGVMPANYVGAFFPEVRFVQPLMTCEPVKMQIRSEELDSVINTQELAVLEFKAMLNSVDDAGWLTARMIRQLQRHANPAPEVPVRLNLSWVLKLNLGQIYALTSTTRYNPLNPYTAARGWSGLLARCVGLKISFDRENPGVQARFQLLNAGNQAKVAPAALVLAKGSDWNGAFFECAGDTYSADGTPDWSLFGDDDRIDLRDKTGAVVESEVVKGTPANGRVYVDGTIASTIDAGDYITFSAWSESNTTAMDSYSALADANETLGAGNDDAKDYA